MKVKYNDIFELKIDKFFNTKLYEIENKCTFVFIYEDDYIKLEEEDIECINFKSNDKTADEILEEKVLYIKVKRHNNIADLNDVEDLIKRYALQKDKDIIFVSVGDLAIF